MGGCTAHPGAEGCPPPQVMMALGTAPPSNRLTGMTGKFGTPSSARQVPGVWGHPSGWGSTCQGGGLCADPPCLSQVYAIISLQLLVTVGIIAVFTFV